jgi:hypothetical protein
LDLDVCLYALTNWAGLQAKGNSSALHFPFAPLDFSTAAGSQVSARPALFLRKSHVLPCLGFADDQMKRLLGQKGRERRPPGRTLERTRIRHKIRHARHPALSRSERRNGRPANLLAQAEAGRIDRDSQREASPAGNSRAGPPIGIGSICRLSTVSASSQCGPRRH